MKPKHDISSNIQSEIDHRVKNNLNIVTSILGLHILDIENGSNDLAKEELRKSKLRIEVVAMVHDEIYKSKDLVNIDFKKYINDLCALVTKTYKGDLRVKIDADNLSLPLNKTLQLGIIINELVTNSLKHSFIKKEQEKKKTICISLKKEQKNCMLTYIEMSKKIVDIEKLKQSKSLGLRLIKLAVKQMKAHMNIRQNGGLVFSIEFGCE